jgi:hypothetical protein
MGPSSLIERIAHEMTTDRARAAYPRLTVWFGLSAALV